MFDIYYYMFYVQNTKFMQKMVHETKKVFGDKDKKKKIEGKDQINDIQNDIRDGINFDINKEFVSNNQQCESENKQNNDVIILQQETEKINTEY